MRLDYKKELEAASKTMILVHEPETLIRMIARMIVQKVQVSHVGILLQSKERNTYILSVSRGKLGLKIPVGFTRLDSHNPLIRFFREKIGETLLRNDALVNSDISSYLRRKKDPHYRDLLVKTAYQMEMLEAAVGVPSYFRDELLGILLLGKKKNKSAFTRKELDFFTAIASDVAMALRNAQLFKELQQELERKYSLFIHTIVALAAAIDAKDHYTHGHTSRVTNISLEIANCLKEKNNREITSRFLEQLHIASLLHDIGKIGISEAILNKEGPLTPEERTRVQEHPLIGVTILSPIKELEDSILGVRHHHERFDGTGYPDGLKGPQIPLIAAIIAVADSFDAMISDRPYRKAFSKEKAVEEIRHSSNTQFVPEVVEAFLELVAQGQL